MRQTPGLEPYKWSPSTARIAADLGIDPIQVIRFDANVRATPVASSRPAALASTLADINNYPHGGLPELTEAIAAYAEVGPENVVLGAGADDLILLTARSFAGPQDSISVPQGQTYPLYRIAAALAGATVADDDPAVTYFCRPNNPTGELGALPSARPLVVDEAYYEYCGETVTDQLDDEVIVLRTFSKAFGLAGARIGYALAAPEVAADLNARQSPAPVSRLSASLALAALRHPPDTTAEVDERNRLASQLRSLGLDPLPSETNFLFVPLVEPDKLERALYERGLIVKPFPSGIRISVRDRGDDDLLLAATAGVLDQDLPPAMPPDTVRHTRVTTETAVRVRLAIRGSGLVHVDTGAGIYDHLFEQLAFHAGFDLLLETSGDVETGPHHTVEDTALALGESLDRALADRRGLARYGSAVVPMDEARAEAAVDLGGRAWSELALERDVGLVGHALTSFAHAARIALHVSAVGRDDHHIAEAAFKATGRALKGAVAHSGTEVPSTKGRL